MTTKSARFINKLISVSADAHACARYCNYVELPSKEELWEEFHYDPETGLLRYKKSSKNGKRKAGNYVVTQTKGYLKTGIGGQREAYVHRIAWKMMTGEDTPLVDHWDRDTFNNKWVNLRKKNVIQNIANSGLPAHNTSGVKGVYWAKDKNKWTAQISIGNRIRYLGRYHSIDEAKAAYVKAAEMHFGTDQGASV